MSRGATFAEVLDQEMAGFYPRGPVSASVPPPPAYQAPHPLLFAKPLLQFGATPYRRTTGTSTASRFVGPVRLPRPVRRPLTGRQRQALDELVALGADLVPDFTARELRSAYRTLARQYHPDRHPASSQTEAARLARVFADLNENHMCLLAELIEPANAIRH